MYSGDEYYDDSEDYGHIEYEYECPRCGKLYNETPDDYCPKCGANSDGEDDA
jgi:rRNA maturation endonuclease Nob1